MRHIQRILAEFRHRRPSRNVLFALLAVLLTLGVWLFASLFVGLPSRDAVGRVGEMAQATEIYDAQDQLAFTLSKERRIEVPLSEVSPNLVQAILAIEDQRFYNHRGFDVRRMVAATVTNIRKRRAAQGASTITQQLARQSFLTPAKTLRRKVQELILASRLEHEFTKAEILEFYLNKVYFGDGLYGVEAASRGYFGKPASDLTVAEAATVAGLVKSPSLYSPNTDLDRAISRRNVVLGAMREQDRIDEGTWESSRTAPMTLTDSLRSHEPFGQYFKDEVRRQLVERFGVERVYEGGLRVFSTVELDAQRAADEAVTAGLKALEERRRARLRRNAAVEDATDLQAALIALDPKTGAVRALVGGRDFSGSSFNRAMEARRQPGSAFKPFVYAAALEAGYTPASIISDLNRPIPTLQGAWLPEDGHAGENSMSLRAALKVSSNRAAVRLLQDVGIARTVGYAKALGVGDVPAVPSLALGSGEVTLQSLTAAFSAFANRGRVSVPHVIRRVEDSDGHVLFETTESSTPVVSETTAFLMSSLMADVINSGTGWTARRAGFTLPAAGKTGTTNDFKDAWFVGFTPSLSAGVWVGYDQPRTIPGGYAADVAVPIWASFMKSATAGDKPVWLPVPAGVTTARVCRLSGQRATDDCEGYTEYFARGTAPSESCEIHKSRGLLHALKSLFTGSPSPPPSAPKAGDPGLQPEQPVLADASVASVAATSEPAPAPKKRGFWSRLFGIGDDKESDRDRERR